MGVKSKLTGRNLAQYCAAVITAALIMLLLFFYFRYDRSRSLRNAMGKMEGDPVLFSEESGFFTEGFTLKLERNASSPEDIEIRYTTNGDEPTEHSPIYESGIDLAAIVRESAADDSGSNEESEEKGDDESAPSIEESRDLWRREKEEMTSEYGAKADSADDGICVIPVRARLIQGEDRSRTVTRTYVIGENVFSRYGAYVVCVSTDSYNLFDYDNGIMIKGSHYQTDIDSGTRPDRAGNYYQTGEEWIKDGHITLFSPDGQVLLEEDAGISAAGYSSRSLPTRSLRAEASESRGSSENVFRLDIFTGDSCYGIYDEKARESSDGGSRTVADIRESGAGLKGETDAFSKLKIRTHGAPQIHIRSVRAEYAKILTDECGFPGLTENRLGAAYLNGEFYTVCDIAPTATKEYLGNLFGLSVPGAVERYKGNDYEIFTQAKILKYQTADLTQEQNCAALEEKVDMDNYLFYYALEVLFNNSDWPFNNMEMWRYLGEQDPDNPYTDGRFRFVLDDMDQILTNGLHSMPEHWSTEVFDYMMKDEKSTFHHVMECGKYRDTFLTYVDDLLRTSFEPEHACDILDDLYAQMRKEYLADYGEAVWQEMLDTEEITKENVREKEALLRTDIEKYLGLSDRYTVRIEAGDGVSVTWGNITLEPGESWENQHYCGTAFDVTAHAQEGYSFSGWEIFSGEADSAMIAQTIEESVLTVSDDFARNPSSDSPADEPEEGQLITIRAVAEKE